METSLPLAETASQLNNHPNSVRIKKLLFCICHNLWENDTKKLNALPLDTLLSELLTQYPTLDELSTRLTQIVQSLNKQSEYSALAELIKTHCKPLYFSPAEPELTATQKITRPQQTLGKVEPKAILFKPNYDPYELRIEVMKYSNPLRAKILSFSTLYYLFEFNPQDWLTLKTLTLDDLILGLFCQHETLDQLHTNLCKNAEQLPEPHEYLQAASVMLQALQNPYQTRQPGIFATPQQHDFLELVRLQKQVANSVTSEEPETEFKTSGNTDGDDEQTCQFFTP